jgi:hypothetical protein
MEKKFTLERVRGAPVSSDDLIAELRRVAKEAGVEVVSQRVYGESGVYDPSTIIRRFGSWNRAVASAGLTAANEINYPDAVLFENIMRLWEHYGRQPRRVELSSPPSTISQSPYNRRFSSWTAALQQFIAFANAEEVTVPEKELLGNTRRGPRDPSLRLRFQVMKRDNFTCRACGKSPANILGLHLHVDHVVPWSAGGETVGHNLQTLCEPCNLGKSDVL